MVGVLGLIRAILALTPPLRYGAPPEAESKKALMAFLSNHCASQHLTPEQIKKPSTRVRVEGFLNGWGARIRT